jgi:cell division transport system ATP-binding protein
VIEAVDVSLRYRDGTLALKCIDLQVSPGEVVYITGPSGSGKTSLLKLLMGIERPASGILKVLGENLAQSGTADLRRVRRLMGPVFQEFKLINGRTAFENVMLGMRFIDITVREMKRNAMFALEMAGLEHKAQVPVEKLSWGERQRVAVARAVARKPALILADEPTGNLDRENAMNILSLLESFRNTRTAVIITTHATHLVEETENVKTVRIENGCMCLERWG